MSSSGLSVGPFVDSDADDFVRMAHWMQSNSNYEDCGFEVRKVLWMFSRIMNDPRAFGVVIRTDEGRIVGGFLGELTEYYFSNELIASDTAFMILPEYRTDPKETQQLLREMLAHFEQWAKDAGAMEVNIATSSGIHGDRLEPFLHAEGYTTVGFSTKKRMK